MYALRSLCLGILGSLETQQLEILGFLRWMHAVVREHVELRARLEVSIIVRADDACESILLYATRERRGKADVR